MILVESYGVLLTVSWRFPFEIQTLSQANIFLNIAAVWQPSIQSAQTARGNCGECRCHILLIAVSIALV